MGFFDAYAQRREMLAEGARVPLAATSAGKVRITYYRGRRIEEPLVETTTAERVLDGLPVAALIVDRASRRILALNSAARREIARLAEALP